MGARVRNGGSTGLDRMTAAASTAGRRRSRRPALGLAAWLAMPWQPAIALTVTLASCPQGAPAAVEQQADRLRFQLPAGSHWIGWSQEQGSDLAWRDAAESAWIDSWPSRYALDPWLLTAAADGTVEVEWRQLSGTGTPQAQVQLRCVDRDATAIQRFQRLRRLAAAQASWSANPAPAHGLALVGELLAAQVSHLDHPRALLWLRYQATALARRAGLTSLAGPAFAELATRSEQANEPALALMADLAHRQWQLQHGRAEPEQFEHLAARASVLGMPYPAAVAAHDRCIALRYASRYQQAAACYRAAERRYSELGEPSGAANARLNEVRVWNDLGELQHAAESLRSARRWAGADPGPRLAARIATVSAQLHAAAGQFDAAQSDLQQAARLYQRGYPLEYAQTLARLADNHALAERPWAARAQYRQALEFFDERAAGAWADDTRLKLARVEAALGQPAEAQALLARLTSELPPDDARWQQAQLLQADLHYRSGELETAATVLKQLQPQLTRAAWRPRAQALVLQGQPDWPAPAPPLQQVEAAVAAAAAQARLPLYLQLSELWVRRLSATGQGTQAQQQARLALERGLTLATGSRSPELRTALLQTVRPLVQWPLDRAGDAADLTVVVGGLERLRAIEQQPSVVPPSTDPLLRRLERLLTADLLGDEAADSAGQLADLLAELDAVNAPGLAARPDSSLPQRLLMGDLLLYPVLAGHQLHLLWLDQHGWQRGLSLPARPLRESLRALQAELAAGHSAPDRIERSIAELADRLAWPPAQLATADRLLVVAEGELGALPWELLPLQAQRAQPLADRIRLQILQSLRRAPSAVGIGELHLATSGRPSSLAPLAALQDEVAAVRNAWPARPQTLNLDGEAGSLLEALTRPGSLVHIGAHGRSDSGHRQDAGLWLQTDGAPSLLSAWRLRRHPVAAELVVVNACDSGRLIDGRRFGLAGVAGSLVDAGAGAVLATRWAVPDHAAARFAEHFHRALAERPAAPDWALQQAQAALRQQPANRHPAIWAAWFLLRPGLPTEPSG